METMKKYIKLRPNHEEREFPDAHWITLSVGNQSFDLAYIGDTKKEAEWMADMLAVALGKLTKELP